jgi:hypothetical protein
VPGASRHGGGRAWVLAAVALTASLSGAQRADARSLPPAVAIDTRDVADADFQTLGLVELASKLALRLTQAGYAVVAREHRPLIAIFLRAARPTGDKTRVPRLEIRVASARHWRRRAVARGKASMATFHLEALHKTIAATREVEAAIRAAMARRPAPPAPAPEKPPGLGPDGTPVVGRKREPWPEPRQQVGIQPLALIRSGGTDVLFRVGGRVRLWETAIGARWSLRYSPSTAQDGGSELSVSEWGIELGADWRLNLSSDRRFRLDLGLLAGFTAHRYSFGAAGSEEELDSGTRWDLSASAFAQLGLRISRRFGLVLWFAGGLAEDEREHRLAGRASPMWRRSRWRLEAGGGLRLAI